MLDKKLFLPVLLLASVSFDSPAHSAIISFNVAFTDDIDASRNGNGTFLYDDNPGNNGFIQFDLDFGASYTFSQNQYTGLSPDGSYSPELTTIYNALTNKNTASSIRFPLDQPFFDGSSIAGGLAIDGYGWPATSVGLANGPGTYNLFNYYLSNFDGSYYSMSSGSFVTSITTVPIPPGTYLLITGLVGLALIGWIDRRDRCLRTERII